MLGKRIHIRTPSDDGYDATASSEFEEDGREYGSWANESRDAMNEAPDSSLRKAEEDDPVRDEEMEKLRDQWMRTAADLENFRKQYQSRMQSEVDRQRNRLLLTFLPVLDNMTRSLAAGRNDASNPWAQGLAAIRHQMLQALESEGVFPMTCVGRTFDPRSHEAMAVVPQASSGKGHIIVEEVRPGYVLRDGSVLRPAQVIVTGGGVDTRTEAD